MAIGGCGRRARVKPSPLRVEQELCHGDPSVLRTSMERPALPPTCSSNVVSTTCRLSYMGPHLHPHLPPLLLQSACRLHLLSQYCCLSYTNTHLPPKCLPTDSSSTSDLSCRNLHPCPCTDVDRNWVLTTDIGASGAEAPGGGFVLSHGKT